VKGQCRGCTNIHGPVTYAELQHALERAIILSGTNVLQPEDFNFTPSSGKEDGQLSLDQYNLEEVEKAAHPQSPEKIQREHYSGSI
jgi:hypothetical protein